MFDLIRHEWRFLFQHRALFLLMTVAFTGYGLIINVQEIGVGMDLLKLNAPYRLAFFVGLTSMLAVFVTALTGTAVFCESVNTDLSLWWGIWRYVQKIWRDWWW